MPVETSARDNKEFRLKKAASMMPKGEVKKMALLKAKQLEEEARALSSRALDAVS